jgi:hypothetical protein
LVVSSLPSNPLQENARLREELAKQYSWNAASQQEAIDLRAAFDEERRQLRLQRAAGVFLERFKKWRLVRATSPSYRCSCFVVVVIEIVHVFLAITK